MRRALIIGVLAVLAVAGSVFALGAGDAKGKTYKIVLDNAFGLVKGADFKVGGVAVGSISDLDVTDQARAIVEVTVNNSGGAFAGLHQSAECEVAPQSLIGEYFIDCQPGTEGPLLEAGAIIPVDQTTSPIPPDLVLNIMRLPVRERFRLVFGELGVGFAARGDDVNETIRRAIPALKSTSDTLELLADRRETIADLSRESGQVLKVLGERREDVTDFVSAARDAASATAERRAEVAATFQRFPGFLDELEPTMNDLAFTSRRLAPTLADLRAAAPTVTSLLQTLQPFARASEPAITTLGDASDSGVTAAREASSLVQELGGLGAIAAEPSKNLRIILDHLNDRDFATEDDPDSPGGDGYTGLEAPLQYIFDQSLAANIFDQRGYSLKINLTAGPCSNYQDADGALADAALYQDCNQNLGPNQPGITTPDPGPGVPEDTRTASVRADSDTSETSTPAPETTVPPTTTTAPEPTTTAPEPTATVPPALKPLEDLIDQLPQLIDPVTGKLRDGVKKNLGPLLGKAAPSSQSAAPTQDLLDFLLSP